jgi:hypothetical protein
MQLQQNNFWQSCNKLTTAAQPTQLLQTILLQDLIPFAKFLLEKTMIKMEESLS